MNTNELVFEAPADNRFDNAPYEKCVLAAALGDGNVLAIRREDSDQVTDWRYPHRMYVLNAEDGSVVVEGDDFAALYHYFPRAEMLGGHNEHKQLREAVEAYVTEWANEEIKSVDLEEDEEIIITARFCFAEVSRAFSSNN